VHIAESEQDGGKEGGWGENRIWTRNPEGLGLGPVKKLAKNRKKNGDGTSTKRQRKTSETPLKSENQRRLGEVLGTGPRSRKKTPTWTRQDRGEGNRRAG